MSGMLIEEAMRMKEKLESDFLRVLKDFEKTTGLTVMDVNVLKSDVVSVPRGKLVKITITAEV